VVPRVIARSDSDALCKATTKQSDHNMGFFSRVRLFSLVWYVGWLFGLAIPTSVALQSHINTYPARVFISFGWPKETKQRKGHLLINRSAYQKDSFAACYLGYSDCGALAFLNFIIIFYLRSRVSSLVSLFTISAVDGFCSLV